MHEKASETALWSSDEQSGIYLRAGISLGQLDIQPVDDLHKRYVILIGE